MEPSNTLNRKRTSPFRYGFGMLGTSIPINMLKSYAAAYYVLKLGLITTDQMAKILFIYTFVDAIDNPVYGFLSDRTHTKWGKRRPWLVIGTPLMILCFVLFYKYARARAVELRSSLSLYSVDVHTHRYARFAHERKLRRAVSDSFQDRRTQSKDQCYKTGLPACRDGYFNRAHSRCHFKDRL